MRCVEYLVPGLRLVVRRASRGALVGALLLLSLLGNLTITGGHARAFSPAQERSSPSRSLRPAIGNCAAGWRRWDARRNDQEGRPLCHALPGADRYPRG